MMRLTVSCYNHSHGHGGGKGTVLMDEATEPAASAVRLVEYSSDWPLAFHDVESRVRLVFRSSVMRLDHIGSTSVPGLLSKDVIDVQLGVESLDLGLSAPLEQAGFLISENIRRDHIPPGGLGDPADWAKRFATGTAGGHSVNLHVRRIGASNWRYALLFRDFLRSSPVASAAYARAKVLLAPLCPSVDVYADVKDPICDLVMVAAAAWGVQTGWDPLED